MDAKLSSHKVTGRQCGAVLIVSLVILLVLTIVGIAGVQNSTMEERMAGNYRDRFTAFQAAESALRHGEYEVGIGTTFAALDFGTTSGAYEVTATGGSKDPFDDSLYLRTVTTSTISGILSQPVYFIERLPKVPLPKSSLVLGFQGKPKDIQYYRVTGKSAGVSGKAEVILQSVYHR